MGDNGKENGNYYYELQYNSRLRVQAALFVQCWEAPGRWGKMQCRHRTWIFSSMRAQILEGCWVHIGISGYRKHDNSYSMTGVLSGFYRELRRR